ncbi:MAG: rod shape-determining protein MreD [Chloroflexi bacterium]|nr:rod shape-determining protein MreD [Chloroflexota bacterium]
MSNWVLIPLLLLVAVLQATLLPLVPVFGFTLDLALVLVIGWGLVGPAWQAAQWGFTLGLFLDLISGLPFGAHTLSLTLIGLLMSAGQLVFFRSNLAAPPIAAVLATLIQHLIILSILAFTGQPIAWDAFLLRVTLPTALLNTLTLTALFLPLRWLAQRVAPQMEFH